MPGNVRYTTVSSILPFLSVFFQSYWTWRDISGNRTLSTLGYVLPTFPEFLNGWQESPKAIGEQRLPFFSWGAIRPSPKFSIPQNSRGLSNISYISKLRLKTSKALGKCVPLSSTICPNHVNILNSLVLVPQLLNSASGAQRRQWKEFKSVSINCVLGRQWLLSVQWEAQEGKNKLIYLYKLKL